MQDILKALKRNNFKENKFLEFIATIANFNFPGDSNFICIWSLYDLYWCFHEFKNPIQFWYEINLKFSFSIDIVQIHFI